MSTDFHQIPLDETWPAFCGQCGREIPAATAVCAHGAIPATVSPLRGWVSGFVRASGRTRKAGYWVGGGGVAVVLSAFLPWVSVDGIEDSHPAGGGVLLLLAIGGLFAYFGGRVLQNRMSKTVNVTLWVLAGVDVALSVGLFAAESRANTKGAGIISVAPATGFYVGLGGLIASVVGTVLVQTVRRRHPAATGPNVH
jgi:hypothetical protein